MFKIGSCKLFMTNRNKVRKINRAIKIRIYPNTDQRIQIEKTIGCSRFVYNCMLADKVEYYKKDAEKYACQI